MKIYKITGLAYLFLTIGCATASMIKLPGKSSSVYAPTNEESLSGTIKYLNDGADFLIKKRREDAYRQMYEACHSKYNIVSEGPNSVGGIVTDANGKDMYSSSEFWYINFKCEK